MAQFENFRVLHLFQIQRIKTDVKDMHKRSSSGSVRNILQCENASDHHYQGQVQQQHFELAYFKVFECLVISLSRSLGPASFHIHSNNTSPSRFS